MPLPTTPTVNTAENISPDRIKAIIHGPQGSGKTSLAAGWYPQTNLIIDPEQGLRHLAGAHQHAPISTYDEFTALVIELAAGRHPFTTVTIDTIDSLVRLADRAAGQRGGKVAAGMVPFGVGKHDREGIIMRDLEKLLSLGLGVILTAYSVAVTVVRDDGTEEERLMPRIDKEKPEKSIRGDIVGLFDYVMMVRKYPDERRELVTGGALGVETKSRFRLPHVIPLPDPLESPQGGALALHGAVTTGIQRAFGGPSVAPVPVTQPQAVAS